MKFSALVTCYNYRAYVEQAVDSALAQGDALEEVVVVDDGSTDGSGELVAQRYAGEKKVRLIHKANGGQLSAFRAGIGSCSGDILCFLDADDWWKEGYVANLRRLYAALPSHGAVFTNLQLSGNGQDDTWHSEAGERDLGLSVLNAYFNERWEGSPTSGIAMRSTLARRVLDIPDSFDPEWRTRADDVLVYGASLLGAQRFYCGRPLVNYRVHGGNAWMGRQPSATDLCTYLLRRRQMIEYFAAGRGLGPGHSRYAKYEFRTKSAPTAADLKDYCRVLRLQEQPWYKRVEVWVALRKHFRRQSSRA